MNVRFSPQLINDLTQTVQSALLQHGIINVPRLAEEIRKRNEMENVALEDIAAQLMVQALASSAAMEFDSSRAEG